jgi:hypothetical protein
LLIDTQPASILGQKKTEEWTALGRGISRTQHGFRGK